MINSAMLVCSFYLKKKFCRKESSIYDLNHEIVATVDDSQISFPDFFSLLSSFCTQHESFFDNQKSRKMFSIQSGSLKSFDKPAYRAMSFIIKSGSYGVEADMTNRRTLKVSYHRSEDEADVKLFHCIVYIPKDIGGVHINKGIFVFQSIATYGVKTITVDTMKRYFSELGFTIETRSVSVQAFLQKLIAQGALNKITFYRNNRSPNDVDNILIATGHEEQSFIRPQLRQEWLDKVLKLFAKADQEKIIEIPDDENFDDLSIQFMLGKNARTVRLKNLDRLSIVEDIPEGIISKTNDTNLIKYMIETADAYKQNIVFVVSDKE